MLSSLGSTLGRLRVLGYLEGVSFLLLLGVAMPLKYLAGMPQAVRVAGMAHGVFFLGYCLAIALATVRLGWSMRRALIFFGAAFVPCGPFLVDAKILSKLSDSPEA
jgi:integral membrane protein